MEGMSVPGINKQSCLVTSVLLCSMLFIHATTEPCDPPAEEGRPYTFTYRFQTSNYSGITWSLNVTNLQRVSHVSLCLPYVKSDPPRCTNYIEDTYEATIQYLPGHSSGYEYVTNLTILEATESRDATDWLWTSEDDPSVERGRCTLQFYSLPEVSLEDCPNDTDVNSGYIKIGTSTTCSCHITHPGLPAGQANWVDSTGNILSKGDESGGPANISLSYNSSDPSPTYICQGTSSYGSGPNITYAPKFAYGPNAIFISVANKTSTINFCPETSDSPTIETFCDITTNSSHPGITVELLNTVSNNKQSSLEHIENSTFERFHFEVQLPQEGGILKPRCVASNLIFSDLMAVNETEISVQAPPLSPPSVTVDNILNPVMNGSSFTVVSGRTIAISCHVEGGHPKVSNTTVQCENHTKSSVSELSVLTLKVSQDMNLARCVCSANHMTGCYHKTTEFTLNVQYGASVENFKSSNDENLPQIRAGMNVTLTCSTFGNPPPSVKLQANRTSKSLQGSRVLQVSGFRTERLVTKVFECEDTDHYVCEANNGIRVARREIFIPVICPPEFQVTNTSIEPSQSPNGKLTMNIPILGHPKPYIFSLTKEAQCPSEVTNGILNFVPVNPSLYKVVYLPGEDPYGTVHLEMGVVVSKDVGIYRLVIGNGIGPGLLHTFYVGDQDDGEEDDGMRPVIIAVIVAIFIVIITNIIVAVVFYILGKRTEQKSQNIKKEPRVQYVSSPPYEDGEHRPHRDAYVDIDFVNLETPSSTDDHLDMPNGQTLTEQRNDTQRPYTAQAPPGNLYLYDLPKQPRSHTYNNNLQNNNTYINSSSNDTRNLPNQRQEPIYERLRESAMVEYENRQVKKARTLPNLNLGSKNSNAAYHEIPLPPPPENINNDDDTFYHQVPSNIPLKQKKDIGGNIENSYLTPGNGMNERKESETSDIYQQISPGPDSKQRKESENSENAYQPIDLPSYANHSKHDGAFASRPTTLGQFYNNINGNESSVKPNVYTYDPSQNDGNVYSETSPKYELIKPIGQKDSLSAKNTLKPNDNSSVHNSEPSPKYEVTKSLFSDPKLSASAQETINEAKTERENTPTSASLPPSNAQSEYEIYDRDRDSMIHNNVDDNGDETNHYVLPSPHGAHDDSRDPGEVTYTNTAAGNQNFTDVSKNTNGRVVLASKNSADTGAYEQVDINF